MTQTIIKQIKHSIRVKEMILENIQIVDEVKNITLAIVEAYRNGNKTLLAGNGGSAADAQHIAGELVSRFYFDRPALASIALTTDTSILTAVGNDYGYEHIFSRQIQANGKAGDVFIAISTSGNSKNIVKAILEAKKMNIITVGLTGENGGKVAEISDFVIKIPSKDTPRVQESHILIGHIISEIVEKEMFGK